MDIEKRFTFRGKKYIWRFKRMNPILQFLAILGVGAMGGLTFFAFCWIPYLWGLV